MLNLHKIKLGDRVKNKYHGEGIVISKVEKPKLNITIKLSDGVITLFQTSPSLSDFKKLHIMRCDRYKTDVTFRKFPKGDIIALFYQKGSPASKFCPSYMHIGQHSDASIELLDDLQQATFAEYKDLYNELHFHCGYRLEVTTNQQLTAHRQPTKGEINFGYGAIHYADFNLSEWLVIRGKSVGFKKWFKGSDGLRYYR